MFGLEVALGLVVVVLALLYFYLTATFSYWKDKGVTFIKPLPLVGSMLRVMTLREHFADYLSRKYHEHQGEPYTGYFQGRVPSLLVFDPELIKNIMVKDFNNFVDHGFKVHEDADPLQARNLFNMEGQRWKDMRTKLTPTFTSGRMKAMFPLVQECADEFEKYLGTLADTGKDLDIKDLLARFSTDVISSCAFGVKCDSINDPNTLFRVMGRKIVENDSIRAIKNALITFAPELSMRFRLSFLSKELTEFFRKMVSDVMKLRATTGATRKDFMQLLIELKNKGRLSPEFDEKVENAKIGKSDNGHAHIDNSKLTEDDVTAQAMVFFFAGFETSSTSLTYALFELARQPELQRKARKQIDEVLERHDGKISYEALQEMTYLDCIFQESLRKYPPVIMLMRVCTKNYIIPGSKVTIEEGTPVTIPIHALQNDPKHFPNPEKFNPERFSDEDQNQKRQYVYMPFGEGPRQCIGLRFARMQSKLCLVSILRRFEVQPSPSTKYPLSLDPHHFLYVSKEDVFLKLSRLQGAN